MKKLFKKIFWTLIDPDYLFDQQENDYIPPLTEEVDIQFLKQSEFQELINKTEKIIVFRKDEAYWDNKGSHGFMDNKEPIKVAEIKDIQENPSLMKHFELSVLLEGFPLGISSLWFAFISQSEEIMKLGYFGDGILGIHAGSRFGFGEIKNHGEFYNWLKTLGIPRYLEMWIEDEKRKKESEKRLLEWKKNAPESLIEILTIPFEGGRRRSIKEDLLEKLRKEIPNDKKLALQLFKLIGFGFYDWSGVFNHEESVFIILEGMNIQFLNEIIKTEELDKEQKEGIARFLLSSRTKIRSPIGHYLAHVGKSDIKKLSRKTKKVVSTHLKEMKNKEKIRLYEEKIKYLKFR